MRCLFLSVDSALLRVKPSAGKPANKVVSVLRSTGLDFPESPKPVRTPQDGHGCQWQLLPCSKSHDCTGSSPGEQAGVSLTENIAHDYSDGDWLMNT